MVSFGVGRILRFDLRSKRTRSMRTIFLLASAVLTSAAVLTSPAMAEERVSLTPPLYRDQAPAMQQGHRLAVLTTTPQPVPAAASDLRTASMIKRSLDQASAEARR